MEHDVTDAVGANGRLRITYTDSRTGEIEVVLDHANHIVDTGIRLLSRSINPKITTGTKLTVIKFGDDVGVGGTDFAPIPPTDNTIAADQNVVYSVPPEEMSYSSTDTALSLSFSMSGQEITGGLDYIRYSSAAIYDSAGNLFSYKRFPLLALSKWMRVTLEWTIEFDRVGSGEGTTPTSDLIGVVIDLVDPAVEVGKSIQIRGYRKLRDGTLIIVPNGPEWRTNNSNIALSNGPNGSVTITGGIAGATTVQLRSGDYATTALIQIREQSD